MVKYKTILGAVAGAGLALSLSAAGVAASVLYGVTGAGGSPSSLYTIDPLTGDTTLIGATGFNEIVSIDFDPVSGLLYGISNLNNLVTINTMTGVATAVAAAPSFKSPDMTFTSDGTLYTWSEPGPDNLNSVDLGTGVATEIGSNPLSTYQMGLDANSADVIYGKSANSLFTVDSVTGATTDVGIIAGGDLDNILAFDEFDNLFSFERGVGLFGIDIGALTASFIGSADGVNFAALAFAPVPVPAALPLLVTAIGGLGFMRRRHKSS